MDEQKRLILFLVIAMGLLFLWQAIERSRRPAPAPAPSVNEPAPQRRQLPVAAASGAPSLSSAAFSAHGQQAAAPVYIGSADPASGYNFQVELLARGASVGQVLLAHHKASVAKDSPPYRLLGRGKLGPMRSLVTSAVLLGPPAAKLEQMHRVELSELDWKLTGPTDIEGGQQVRFEATITDEKQQPAKPVLLITKTYRLEKSSHELRVQLSLRNFSSQGLKVVLISDGPTGMQPEPYRDRLLAIVGTQTGPKHVSVDWKTVKFKSEQRNGKKVLVAAEPVSLPDSTSGEPLVWAGIGNRYFAALMYFVPRSGDELACDYIDQATLLGLPQGPNAKDAQLLIRVMTTPFTLASAGPHNGGSEQNFELAVYLGGKDPRVFAKNERFVALNYRGSIQYGGGCCTFLTFDWLARAILWLLNAIHSLLGNYGLAIIVLVVIVRLALHPLSKSSQVNMAKMSRQMAKLKPELDKLKKQYGKNRRELQQAQMELYRKHGINPASQMMGCLPMLLQMPIWIALYGSLMSAIELRHAHAYLIPGFWIKDLSAPDALISWKPIHIPLFCTTITLSSLNILPILMGVAMFLQQKFTPQAQPTGEVSPQMQQSQKMMKFMFLFFPLLFYGMPSGLTLYILTSTLAGIVDSYFVRKHLQAEESQQQVAPAKAKPRRRR